MHSSMLRLLLQLWSYTLQKIVFLSHDSITPISNKNAETIQYNLEKPHFMRIQQNTSNKQSYVGIPIEIMTEMEWEKGDTIRFTIKDKDRVILDKLG